MVKANILIVEDELLIANSLQRQLEHYEYACVGIAMSAEKALWYLKSRKIDLILLDIQITGNLTGIDIAKISNQKYNIPFIYLTSFSDTKTLTALKETRPLGYLPKPVNATTLIATLDIALNNLKVARKDSFKLVLGKSTYVLELNKLLFVKADHIYLDMVFTDNSITIRASLANILKLLPEGSLFQVNRSFAINPSQITKYHGNKLSIGTYHFTVTETYKLSLAHLL